ncbi:BQ2448_1829 [Microbotryum intermedium]|uniref:BQ2448_1829 protein n=1 Tax=Microbotryum intermedium TaxID=269621 RepID=A0A238FB54_9BASI|nr:BQ2448_1829 [Microbotryum intermedium]
MPSSDPGDLVASIDQLVLAIRRTHLGPTCRLTAAPRTRARRRLDHLSRLLISVQRLTRGLPHDRTTALSDWIRLSTLLQLVDQDCFEHSGSSEDEDDDEQDDRRRQGSGSSATRHTLHQLIQEIQEQVIRPISLFTRKRRRPRDPTSSTDDEEPRPTPSPEPSPPRTTPETLRERLDQAYALHLAVHDPDQLDQHRKIGPLPLPPAPLVSNSAPPPDPEESFEPPLSTTERILSRFPPQWTQTTLSRLHSNPQPTLDELKRLLWTYADPLIPSRLGQRQLKPLLRAQFLSPTPRPLDYPNFKSKALHPLFELLGRLCSPARDEQARALVEQLERSQQVDDVVQMTVAVLVMMDQMEVDLRFARRMAERHLGAESDGRKGREQKAIEVEREVVREVGRRMGSGTVKEETERWIRARIGPSDIPRTMGNGFRKALLEAMFDSRAVSCIDIDPIATATSMEEGPPNRLPLTLLVPAPRIFKLQNQLQALIIVACLNSIVNANLGAGNRTQTQAQEERSVLMTRLWALLKGMVDFDSSGTGREVDTTLVNLLDELMRTYRRTRTHVGEDGESGMKEKEVEMGFKRRLESVLRYEDPVFRLFSKRLKEGIEMELEKAFSSTSASMSGTGRSVPIGLKTGRQVLTSSASSSSSSNPTSQARKRFETLDFQPVSIKGFEGLQEPLGQVIHQIERLLHWVHKVWGNELDWNMQA